MMIMKITAEMMITQMTMTTMRNSVMMILKLAQK